MSAAPHNPMTIDAFREYAAEHGRCELIEGEVHPLSPAGYEHGRLTSRLHHHITSHVYANDLGEVFAAETGFRATDGRQTVRAPDIAFIQTTRLPATPPEAFGEVMPDLVVETVSPTDTATAVGQKATWWLDQGVRLVWILDPANRDLTARRPDGTARVHREADEVSGDDVLPGFTLKLSELFK